MIDQKLPSIYFSPEGYWKSLVAIIKLASIDRYADCFFFDCLGIKTRLSIYTDGL